MLETLYSTGMRRSELLSLKVDDVDIERRTVMIRRGKGRNDRLLPIGERAVAWIDKYLRDARPSLTMGRDEGILFLTELGESMSPEYVTHRMRRYVEAAEVGKKGACHILRAHGLIGCPEFDGAAGGLHVKRRGELDRVVAAQRMAHDELGDHGQHRSA
jgi:site-specific recombinase XerD